MPVSEGLVTSLVLMNLAPESLFALYESKTLIAYLLLDRLFGLPFCGIAFWLRWRVNTHALQGYANGVRRIQV